MALQSFSFNKDVGDFECFVEFDEENNNLQPWRASKYINDKEFVSYGETPEVAALMLCSHIQRDIAV
ncbi:hypothetical protein Desaci_0525 [Desulfosporosinus acidiphilus SJ4]|uniref:Uncharacterized protein n=1 Tax=Desulfosporosinus acidiphilus (strain DSM 22704 / JCM 16185 / SJ4) TaxID=646529 RepID=I4D1B7_DESAJ|nr:hypothetical protein [Desulfosporosinus acidiphilus]AFM39591.1 hypothetical protein Desaci_0525 [Desulfosporosinus acidiphilus SJ4]